MRKNVINGLTLLLIFFMISTGYLFFKVDSLEKRLQHNQSRISFMENNFDGSVRDLILQETKNKDSDLLEDVKYTISELTDKKAKKAMVDLQFKLKRIDSTSKTYANIECGDEEPYLMEIIPVNDTTYKIEKEICLLKPLRVDLVIEKYGEKNLINVIAEKEMYTGYVGETNFKLNHFDYRYDEESKTLRTSFSTDISYLPKDGKKLEEAYVLIEKNGVILKSLPLEIIKEYSENEAMLYRMEINDLELLGLDQDEIIISAMLQEKSSFIHRYEFVRGYFEDGEVNIMTDNAPILILK